MRYFLTGNGADVAGKCSTWGYCKEPVLPGFTYSFDGSCNPYLGSCSGIAEMNVEFPGNHQNDPSSVGFYYSFVKLDLFNSSGTPVGG